jgi:predicted phosphohydrolase
MSDLHLSLGTNKPMEVFGGNWDNYVERIRENWNKLVSSEDTVLISGDVSWAMYLEECEADFAFINALSGRKIISKGNHDYWWTTAAKHYAYTQKFGFTTIDFMNNNAYNIGNAAICGSRGYIPKAVCKTAQDEKIFNRELERFELSAKGMDKAAEVRIAAMHYPPDDNFEELFHKYAITHCVYGHLHDKAHANARQGLIDGVYYNLVSADYLKFSPLKIF